MLCSKLSCSKLFETSHVTKEKFIRSFSEYYVQSALREERIISLLGEFVLP